MDPCLGARESGGVSAAYPFDDGMTEKRGMMFLIPHAG